MVTKVGINGFGRMGRQILKAVNDNHSNDLEVVVFNDLGNAEMFAHLFKYDSNFGIYPGTVEVGENSIIVNGKAIKFVSEKDPAKIPWKQYGVEIVVESTGLFTDAKAAAAHLQGGAKKVIISAPAKNEDVTLVMGVNEKQYDARKHNVISNASCTTNCIAPMIKVLHDNFGVQRGLMTTVHSYTNDQVILDRAHKDLRRARAAALNIIPTTTGAARVVGQVIPELKGKLDGLALRVPTPTVSITDFVANLNKEVTVDEVNAAFKVASEGPMKGILEYCDKKLVSIDFKGNQASCILDVPSTMVLGNMIKILGWYDNEWGYSCRIGDVASYIASKGL